MSSTTAPDLPKLLIMLGPTASGKTELGILLAKEFNGEIVSADSRQIYKEFTIGTAKPRGRWQIANGKSRYIADGVAHHLVDEISPKEKFVLPDFKEQATEKIIEITSRNKLAIIVGGTALYINALVDNLKIPQVPPNKTFRSHMQKKTVEELFTELNKLDPKAAELTGKNKRRIIRALEVINATGKPFSKQRTKGPRTFDALKIGIGLAQEELEARIAKRIDRMIKDGLVEEVKSLNQEYSWDLPPMQSIGYQEFRDYLEGKESLEEALAKLRKSYKRLVHHQNTWFKKDKEINWISDYREAEKLVKDFLK